MHDPQQEKCSAEEGYIGGGRCEIRKNVTQFRAAGYSTASRHCSVRNSGKEKVRRKGGTENGTERVMIFLCAAAVCSGCATGTVAWLRNGQAAAELTRQSAEGFMPGVTGHLMALLPFVLCFVLSAYSAFGIPINCSALYVYGMGAGFGMCAGTCGGKMLFDSLVTAAARLPEIAALIMLAGFSGTTSARFIVGGTKKGFLIKALQCAALLCAGCVAREFAARVAAR